MDNPFAHFVKYPWADIKWGSRDADADGMANASDPCPYSAQNDPVLCKQCPLLGFLQKNEILTTDANSDGMYDSCAYPQQAFFKAGEKSFWNLGQLSADGRWALVQANSTLYLVDRMAGATKNLGQISPAGHSIGLSGSGNRIVVLPAENAAADLATEFGITTPCQEPLLYSLDTATLTWSCHTFDAQGLYLKQSLSAVPLSYDGSKVLIGGFAKGDNYVKGLVIDLDKKTTAVLPEWIYPTNADPAHGSSSDHARFNQDGDVIVGNTMDSIRWFTLNPSTESWTLEMEQPFETIGQGAGVFYGLADGARFWFQGRRWHKPATFQYDYAQYKIPNQYGFSDDGRYAVATQSTPVPAGDWPYALSSTVLDVATGKTFTLSTPPAEAGVVHITHRLTPDGRWLVRSKKIAQKDSGIPDVGKVPVLLSRTISPNPFWTPPAPVSAP